ncbi:methylated-DNA--[protein]-cysteine S-methyltransferase [Neiella sp. HB171785]|uniref:Methylated-DNA--[protein]-cysteine S-methyltransferase n=1 Tax=Neiella litorisoli TaxID=2771431 RepID=A0A8J6R4C4_9GAMM|nr:methylated-DNA--[protein]-cysteine S-methyltransferase [Neiella litorisoli]MBD1391390.1 methylated-DNA--[protein]-cysteine S-methyltransferase [Neiella litorisoli]
MLNRSDITSCWGRWQLTDDGNDILALDYWPQSASSNGVSALAKLAQQQLDAYLADANFQFDLPLRPIGTEFQCRVWQHLQQIPVGQVQSYGEAAGLLGSVARAVGGACRRNPIPLFIPCHRIVAKQGIGGFSGQVSGQQIDLKNALLQHEKAWHYGG